jgi:hypothetical protein
LNYLNPLLPLPIAADNAAMPSEPSKAEPPKRIRRWFQFSLRALMIGVAIFSVQCGVCLPMLREWQEQERIREERQRQEVFSFFVSLVR